MCRCLNKAGLSLLSRKWKKLLGYVVMGKKYLVAHIRKNKGVYFMNPDDVHNNYHYNTTDFECM